MNRTSAKKTSITALLILLVGFAFGQHGPYDKISLDLREEIRQCSSSNEMFQVIIIMDTQLDVQKLDLQTKGLNKDEQRTFVINELQQLSESTQKDVLTSLQQGQKAALVDHVQSFWIINGISCALTKDMMLAIVERSDIKCIVKNTDTYLIDGTETETIPDNRGENQWNVTKVNADSVWALGYTGAGVVVAIIDSGVNYNHTDLANNMWDGGTEFPNHGWDFANNDNDPMDDHGHGTHCAGTISSYGTNGKQCGIAKDATIMALKTLRADGHGSKANTWAAIQFAISHDADIMSLSLGSDGTGGLWDDRIVMENALLCGVVASVAAGNVGNTYQSGHLKYPVPFNVSSPGNCPSPWRHPDQTLAGGHTAVVTVGAITINDEHSSFSSIGPSTWTEGSGIGPYYEYPWVEGDPDSIGLIKPDISAPGSSIVSLDYTSNTGYTTMSGTSQATPCVAGVMALMLEADPTLTPREIDSIIETTAIPLGGQTSKCNIYGSGRVDALQAINSMTSVCPAPSNLNAIVDKADVTLTWTAANGVDSYQIHRNGRMIANHVSNTTFTDQGAPAGNNIYYVKSNGTNSQSSLPSNQVSVNITTNINIATPNPLMSDAVESDNVILHWFGPNKRQDTLFYANAATYYMDMGGNFYAAQRFPSAKLQSYIGMQIEHFFFNIQDSGTSCTISFYEGDDLQLDSLVYEGSYTTTENFQTVDYPVNPPITINPNKALWVIVNTAGVLGMDSNYESPLGGDAFYYKFSANEQWSSLPLYAWSFQIGLSDNDFTYTLYRNGSAFASDITNSSYSAPIIDGINQFNVTAITNGYESLPTNKLTFIKNAYSSTTYTLESNEKLIVLPNSTLDITDTLTNTDPENLIIEDGGQLFHHNDGVKATFKKNISGFLGNSGWYSIASPFTNFSPGQIANDIYDLYAYDEDDTLEWVNHKNNPNSFPTCPTSGYLYAHSPDICLSMTGTLNNGDFSETVNLSHDNNHEAIIGFNLLGNPTAHTIAFSKTDNVADGYYYLENNDAWSYEPENNVPPGRGFLVKANEAGQTVTLNPSDKQANTETSDNPALLRIDIDGELAYVKLSKGSSMPLLDLGGRHSGAYLTREGKRYILLANDNNENVDLCYQPKHSGQHRLHVTLDGTDVEYLHLIDRLTGTDIDLLLNPNYSFEATPHDAPERFQLVFNPNNNQ